MITVERLFQRSDHHTGQARLERTSASADGQLIGLIGCGGGRRAPFHDTRDFVDAENRIQNREARGQPSIQPTFSETSLIGGEHTAGRFDRDQVEVRILTRA